MSKEKWYAVRVVANSGINGCLQYLSRSKGEREQKIRDSYRLWHNKGAARKSFEEYHERVTLTIKVEE